jgi:hypothetical protein
MKPVLFAVGASALACVGGEARAQGTALDDVTWQGVNTSHLFNFLNTTCGAGEWSDISSYRWAAVVSTNGHDLWAPARVPGAGDRAVVHFNTASTAVWGEAANDVVLAAPFAPDVMRFQISPWNGPHISSRAKITLGSDIALRRVEFELGNGDSSGSGGFGNLLVPSNRVLSLSGQFPINFGGARGGWNSINVAQGGTLRFDGAEQIFDSAGYSGSYTGHREGRGATEFTMPNAVVTLGDMGVRRVATIMAGAAPLRVRSDQTFLNPSGAGFVTHFSSGASAYLVESIDGGALTNLGNVAFFAANRIVGNDQYPTFSSRLLPAGTFQGLSLYNGSSGAQYGDLKLTGDVELAGGHVVPGDGANNAYQSDFSLLIQGWSRGGMWMDFSGHSLRTARGVRLYGESPAEHNRADAFIDARGANFEIGGDLVYQRDNHAAGHTNAAFALYESRVIGIIGDAGTVVTLHGSFRSPVRSLSREASPTPNLALSTLNLVGGSAARPNTYEIGNAPSDAFANNTSSIGKMNIGAPGLPGRVKLANDNINDNDTTPVISLTFTSTNPETSEVSTSHQHFKPGEIIDPALLDSASKIATNAWRFKEGEILVAGALSIGPQSKLDLNGQTVKLLPQTGAPALQIAPDGWLDLNTSLSLELGDIVPCLVMSGDQTESIAQFKDRIMDSSNSEKTFYPWHEQTLDTLPPFGGLASDLTYLKVGPGHATFIIVK